MGNDDEREVGELFDAYEAALVRNDLDAMNAVFVDGADVLRFGIADMQFGSDELVAWRAAATPVSPLRRIVTRRVLSIAPGVVATDITFVNGDEPFVGRQSQTWVKRPEGWRIIRAHVSVIRA
ncbi:MAG: hypothetical protein JWM34_2542 [Ilumatobacteraceae bacterium]|nr:hypothetical protein [Ilumatobacteraceae bacterium]